MFDILNIFNIPFLGDPSSVRGGSFIPKIAKGVRSIRLV